MQIKYIDGPRLHRAIQAGINHVITRKDYLNKINVFPVPDGDTGTNMTFTLATISEETKSNNNKRVSKVADAVADASLNGARGNSGSILAQFFVGFADGIASFHRLTPGRFSQTIKTSKNYSYDTLSEPKEGTILSVIADWAYAVKNIHETHNDFVMILDFAFEQAQESLRKTQEKLAILKKSGVVDAGTQGFVDFLEGINHFIEKGEMDDVDTSTIAEPVDNFEMEIFDEFRYCTECLVAGNDIDRIKLKEQLMNLGANIVLAGSKKKAKIHIPASVSGTMQSATLAAGDTKDLPIDLIDSQNGSVGIGLIALQAAEAVKAELPKEEILKTRQKNW